MSLAAFWAEATHWDCHAVGKAIRPAQDRSDKNQVFHDVKDLTQERPLEVMDTSIRGIFKPTGPKIWRVSSCDLPADCKSFLWLPASLAVAREVRCPAGVIFDGVTRVPLREAQEELTTRLTSLQPDSGTLVVSWAVPLVSVGFLDDTGVSEPMVWGQVMGPRVQVTLRRSVNGRLEIVDFDGGPDGVEEIARSMLAEVIDEIEAAKAAAEALALEASLKPVKPVFVFGKIFRPKPLSKKADKITWDAPNESFALWSALQQWERSVRREPWRWRVHSVEAVGIDGGQASPSSPSSPSRRRRMGMEPASPSAAGSSKGSPNRSGGTGRNRIATTLAMGFRPRRPSLSASTYKAEEKRALLRAFDPDHSGTIDWVEFRSCSKRLVDLLGAQGVWSEELARHEFEKLDANGNGLIEEEEWQMFVGNFLQALGATDMQRMLTLLGQDMSVFTTRLISMVQGDVDVGLCCKKGHAILPLRLKSWGAHLARSLGISSGFRCAAVDDPAVFAAAWRQRCTKCGALESQATFSVCCTMCTSFSSGWWCTRCVMQAGKPIDRSGQFVPVSSRHRQGACRYCEQPAVVAWPDGMEAEPLCDEHAADKLLEEAARSCAASGREPDEGASLVVFTEFLIDADLEDDEDFLEEFAGSVEAELEEALGFEGASPDRAQLEVLKFSPGAGEDGSDVAVQLVLSRAFGRPSPYELFLRLRSLVVDRDGPLFREGQFSVLSAIATTPELLEVVVCDEDEQTDMTTRVSKIVAERWPHGNSMARTLLVARPQRVLLPRAALLSLRCVKPPEGAGGCLLAYALAFPQGARKAMPKFHEFEAFIDPGSHSKRSATASSDHQGHRATIKAKAKPAASRRTRATTSGRGAGGAGGRAAESGCVVCLSTGPCGNPEVLEGEATLFGLKPGREYDVFVAVFEGAGEQPEAVASMTKTLRTCTEPRFRFFGADADGVIQLLTEEPHVERKECFLDLLGLQGAPCVVDQGTFHLTAKPAGKHPEKSKEAIAENGIQLFLEEPEEDRNNPALAGGLQLHTPTFKAEPSYLAASAELELSVSADVVVLPCPKHRFHGALERPIGLSVGARSTEARCCLPKSTEHRCGACRWAEVRQKHSVVVRISLDIIKMAEIGDWHSVWKRAEVCHPQDTRLAIPVVLRARPLKEADFVMRLFEFSTGRGSEVDFPLRFDGATALHCAVEENHLDVVKRLIDRNLDPCVANKAQETPVHAAARGGSGMAPQIIDMLLEAARSMYRGDDKVVEDKVRARQSLIDAQDLKGRTVLHVAAAGDQLQVVRCLVNAQATLSLTDCSGNTALHAAAAAGALHCTSLLLSSGVNVDVLTSDSRGCTSLHLACQGCMPEAAGLLLQRKADPRIAATIEGNPKQALNFLMEGALCWAPVRGLAGTLQLAKQIVKGAPPSVDVANEAGTVICTLAVCTPTDAVAVDATEALLRLFEQHCNGFSRSQALGRALLQAVAYATAFTSEFTSSSLPLPSERWSLNRVAQAQTPGATASSLPKAVSLALSMRADPNVMDPTDGDTALHMLLQLPAQRRILPNDRDAGEAIAQTINTLIHSKASLSSTNKRGERPIMLAQGLEELGVNYSRAWQELLLTRPHGHGSHSKGGGRPTSQGLSLGLPSRKASAGVDVAAQQSEPAAAPVPQIRLPSIGGSGGPRSSRSGAGGRRGEGQLPPLSAAARASSR